MDNIDTIDTNKAYLRASNLAAIPKASQITAVYDGKLIELTNFAKHHPGGRGLLEWHRNKDITDIFNQYHMHSAIAMNILKSLAIAPKQNTFLNLDRPLIPQILQLRCSKEEYFKHIHIPRYHNNICRFFSQQYLEVLTHTEWWWVPVFWGHIMGWFALCAAKYIGAFSLLICIGLGIALWSAIEYIVHRFAFHAESAWLPSHPFFYTVHFLMHGVHHFLPTENTRLVLPIVFSGSLAIAVWNIYKRAFPWDGIAEAIFVGTILGYVVYDVGHYSIHNMEADKSGLINLVGRKLFKKIKANHMAHHYKTPNARFGVSSTFWDAAFGTGANTYIAK